MTVCPRRSLRAALLLAVGCALAVPVRPAAAQFAGGTNRTDPLPYAQILSLDPVRLIGFGQLAADYERRLTSSTTLGAAVSTYGWDDDSYVTIEGRGRYYVTGRAFDGVALVASSGVTRIRQDSTDVRDYGLGVGMGVERQWLIGREERVALTVGGSFSRLLFLDDPTPFKRVLFGWRISAGWGF